MDGGGWEELFGKGGVCTGVWRGVGEVYTLTAPTMATETDGTYPTEMLSCLTYFYRSEAMTLLTHGFHYTSVFETPEVGIIVIFCENK